MGNKKISELTPITSIDGSEEVPIRKAGTTNKITANDLLKPRVVTQVGGNVINIDPTTTDAFLMTLDENVTLDYMVNGDDEQIVVLKLSTPDAVDYVLSVDVSYKVYDGVTVPAVVDKTKVTTLVLMFDTPSGIWTIYNCSTVTP